MGIFAVSTYNTDYILVEKKISREQRMFYQKQGMFLFSENFYF